MAKPDKPIFSLGARGTIGDALTYQKRGREHIVREKPTPRDPYSLNQAYQRWDYRDYAYLWTLLSNSEKQIYRTKASRYHITGYSLWMREHLKDLPDLAGRWHLDERSGAVAYDSSKNNNNGIIVGASPATGLIAGGYYFDGLNDRIIAPSSPSLNFSDQSFTISTFIHPVDHDRYWISKGKLAARFELYSRQTSIHWALLDNLGVTRVSTADGLGITRDVWQAIAVVFDRENNQIIRYKNGAPTGTIDTFGALGSISNNIPLTLGVRLDASWFKGLLDHTTLINRALHPTEIRRHSERRYP